MHWLQLHDFSLVYKLTCFLITCLVRLYELIKVNSQWLQWFGFSGLITLKGDDDDDDVVNKKEE